MQANLGDHGRFVRNLYFAWCDKLNTVLDAIDDLEKEGIPVNFKRVLLDLHPDPCTPIDYMYVTRRSLEYELSALNLSWGLDGPF